MESTHPTDKRHSSSYHTKRDIIDGWRYKKYNKKKKSSKKYPLYKNDLKDN
jgi:hypothetical protein